ncbi:hypothetical protein O3M35_011082 [Rhynocoris fuscipes]|uniref:Uncharacterized protein n=1 Tax=Rhynocoris fuscipes TaxID=488301 RepID=A0AAW1D144_9HEMI
MPPIKKKKTKSKLDSNHRNLKGIKKSKKSIIPGARMSITPNFVHQVITRSRSKLLKQLSDNCLKNNLLNLNNELSFSVKRKRVIKPIDLIEEETETTDSCNADKMVINSVDKNLEVNGFSAENGRNESIVFPSTSSEQSNILPQTSDTINNTKDKVLEQMEITENLSATESQSVAENISKINNEQSENNFEQIINLTPQLSNDKFSLNNCDDKEENEMKNATTGEVVDLMTQEIWKKKQLYHLQQDILETKLYLKVKCFKILHAVASRVLNKFKSDNNDATEIL